MSSSGQRPLLRIILPFFIGCRVDFPSAPLDTLLVAVISLLLVHGMLTVHPKGWMPYPERWIPGAVILLTSFVMGVALNRVMDQRIAVDHISRFDDRQLTGEVVSVKKQRNGGMRLVVEAVAGRMDSARFRSRSGKLFVYLSDQDTMRVPPVSSIVIFTGRLKSIKSQDIPGQFDFRKWAAMKQIHSQMTPVAFRIVHHSGLSADGLAARCRQWISDRLTLAGMEGQSLALVTALLIGDDDDLSPELVDAFSSTGTLHILSVSGMHVAMVYAAIRWVLSFSPKRWRRRFVPAFSILLIWVYAFITGFSPAVQRAATTLSLFILSGPLRRPADSWNLLSASLLIVLACDPFLSHDAGLQLSYLAVAGILAISKWFEALLSPVECVCRIRIHRMCSCDILRLLGQAASVSIAAQLFTFPLGLYQFRSFPLYFLPANLIIVPLSSLLIYAALITLPFVGTGFPAPFFGRLLNWISDAISNVEYFIEKWPAARLEGIGVTGIECMLLYSSLLFFTFYLVRKKSGALAWMLVFLCLQQGVRIMECIEQKNQNRTVIWTSARKKSVTVMKHGYAVTIADKSRQSDSSWLREKLPDCLDACRVPGNNRLLLFRDLE